MRARKAKVAHAPVNAAHVAATAVIAPVSMFQCPRGHTLPHRVPTAGRCTLDECCRAVNGAHGLAKRAGKAEKAHAQGYAEETERLLDARGRTAAWDAIHPLPALVTAPPLPSAGENVFAYLRKRAQQAAPLALERKIRAMLLLPGVAGDRAAEDILDRVGFSRKAEPTVEYNGPLLIVNLDPSRVPLLNQKPQPTVEGAVLEATTPHTQGETHDALPTSGLERAVPRDAEGSGRVAASDADDAG